MTTTMEKKASSFTLANDITPNEAGASVNIKVITQPNYAEPIGFASWVDDTDDENFVEIVQEFFENPDGSCSIWEHHQPERGRATAFGLRYPAGHWTRVTANPAAGVSATGFWVDLEHDAQGQSLILIRLLGYTGKSYAAGYEEANGHKPVVIDQGLGLDVNGLLKLRKTREEGVMDWYEYELTVPEAIALLGRYDFYLPSSGTWRLVDDIAQILNEV